MSDSLDRQVALQSNASEPNSQNTRTTLREKISRALINSTGIYTFIQRNSTIIDDNNPSESVLKSVECAKSRQVLNNFAELLSCKPTIGIYGASQAGKSYLVSTLSTGGKGQGRVTWDGKEVSFQDHIDPQGNETEATSLVSRFTSEKYEAPVGFPVKVRLISELEVVKICVSAFYSDLDTNSLNDDKEALVSTLNDACKQVSADDFKAFISLDSANCFKNDSLKCDDESASSLTSFSSNNGVEFCSFTPLDVLNLGYFIADKANPYIKSPNDPYWRDFWNDLAKKLPFIGKDKRKELLKKFWLNNPNISKLFDELYDIVEKFKGATTAYVEAKAFVDIDGDAVTRTKVTVMAVQALNEFLSQKGDTVELAIFNPLAIENQLIANQSDHFASLKGPDETEYQLPILRLSKGQLSAVIREVVFAITNTSEFLTDFDILDFPGGRSRKNIKVSEAERQLSSGEFDSTTQMLIRGKVDVLFGSYVDKQQISKLVLCIGRGNQEVGEILAPIEKWVNLTLGSNSSARSDYIKANNACPLFIALTKFDLDFEKWFQEAKDSSVTHGVEKNLLARFENLKGTDWFQQWTKDDGFKNCFIVRNPSFNKGQNWEFLISQNHLISEKEGFTANDESQDSKALEKVSEEFNKCFSKYSDSPNEALKAFLCEDGGVKYLAQTIHKQKAKEDDIIAGCQDKLKESSVIEALKSFIFNLIDTDAESKLKAEKEYCNSVAMNFMQICLKYNCFYMFRDIIDFDIKYIRLSATGNSSDVGAFSLNVCKRFIEHLDKLKRFSYELKNASAQAFNNDGRSQDSTNATRRKIEDLMNGLSSDTQDVYEKVSEIKKDQILALCNFVAAAYELSKEEIDSNLQFKSSAEATKECNSFFMKNGALLESLDVKRNIAGNLSQIFERLISFAKDDAFKNTLYEMLKPLRSDTRDSRNVLMTMNRLASGYISDFCLYAGINIHDGKVDLSQVSPSYKIVDNKGHFRPVIIAKADPEDHPFKFKGSHYDKDMQLPRLDEQTHNQEYNLICNFLSCLTHMSEHIKVHGSSSKSKLGKQDNSLGLDYYKALESVIDSN